MDTPLQAQESSTSKLKRIVGAVAILMVCCVAVWVAVETALRLTSDLPETATQGDVATKGAAQPEEESLSLLVIASEYS